MLACVVSYCLTSLGRGPGPCDKLSLDKALVVCYIITMKHEQMTFPFMRTPIIDKLTLVLGVVACAVTIVFAISMAMI